MSKIIGHTCLCMAIIASQMALAAIEPDKILVYREKTGSANQTHTYTIHAMENGIQVKMVRSGEAVNIEDEVEADTAWATQSWLYRNGSTHSELTGRRSGNQIHLTGQHEGKAIDKVFAIDAAPWKQLFAIDFETFAGLTNGAKGEFWSIGTAGAGNLKCARFVVKPKGLERIPINGQNVSAWHLRISLGGIKSLFWHGDYYFRESDQRFLYFSGRSLFGSLSSKELIAEE